MKKTTLVILSSFLIVSCATNPDKMGASYVSPLQFQDYNCKQIGLEAGRIEERVGQLHGALKKEADNDAVQMGVGLVLLWPTLFWLEGGDDARAVEYQHLKGEYEALQKVAVQKQCGYEFRAQVVPEPKAVQATTSTSRKKKPSEYDSLN